MYMYVCFAAKPKIAGGSDYCCVGEFYVIAENVVNYVLQFLAVYPKYVKIVCASFISAKKRKCDVPLVGKKTKT